MGSAGRPAYWFPLHGPAGAIDRPGRQVRQETGLNRAILDKGWHRLELALTNAARYTAFRF
ncbi:hypothetical protein ACFV9D_27515 [Streptomyces sp. NPDC059875]|uniref:hypothetical protein n=1 Tax=unclassified Streptomyces TaxID=2593676 RepID=UPI0036510406